jgi:hypothetical protein
MPLNGKAWGVDGRTVLAAFFLALVPRIIVGLGAPTAIGDAQAYLIVANNLLLNGCVSMSDPAIGACAPHWGGNQLPGYPAFVAAVYWLFSPDLRYLVVCQSLAAALAISYCVFTIKRCGGSRLEIWGGAILLSMSPVALPWVRFAFTESLSIALAIMILAELINSLHFRSLRIISISILLTAAIFVRFDAAILALPIAVVGLAIHGPANAFLRGLVVCVIVSIPIGAWWLRSLSLGLPSMPTYVSPNGWQIAKGYTAWWKTWIVHQYQYRDAVFIVTSGSYDRINIPASAYRNNNEQAEVKSLLTELAAHSGKPFPKHIDAEFARLAANRRREEPFWQWLVMPTIRAGIMWVNPLVSSGWPISLITGKNKDSGGAAIAGLIRNNPVRIFLKAAIAGYRIVLLGGCIYLLLWSLRSRAGPTAFFLSLALTYVLVRTAIFAQTGLVENRYLIPAIPFLEIGCVYGVSTWLRLRNLSNLSPQ